MTATEKTPAPRVVTTTRATACPKCAQPPTTSSLVHAAPGQVLHRCDPCDERWATTEAVRPTEPSVEDRLANIERVVSGLLGVVDVVLPLILRKVAGDSGQLADEAQKSVRRLIVDFETRRPT